MSSKKRRKGKSSEEEGSQVQEEAEFEPYESDNSEIFWDVKCILNEKPGFYFVDWDGIDPATGEPWPASWVAKTDCTDDLIQEWKAAKRKKKEEAKAAKFAKSGSKKASVASLSRNRRTTRSRSATSRSAPTSPTSHASPVIVISRKRRRVSPEFSEASSASASDEEEEEEEPAKPLRKKRRIAPRDLGEARNQLGSSSELVDDQEEMEQDDDGCKRPATPPPPTPAPRRPPIKPSNVVHSSPSVIPGTQTQTEWTSNRVRTGSQSPPQSRPKKSALMRPVPVVSIEAFKRTTEPLASQIEEFSSPPERLTKKTALTQGMNWPEKPKPPIQRRPLEDILSKPKSQTVDPMKNSTLRPISSQHPPSSKTTPHKAAKGRPGVDAEGSQDPTGNVQTESDDTSLLEDYSAFDDGGWDEPIKRCELPVASHTANTKSRPSDQAQELKDTLRLRDNTIEALESRVRSYEAQVHRLKTDNRRFERTKDEALDKHRRLTDVTSLEIVALSARVEALEKERAEALQEKASLEQKLGELISTSSQVEMTPNKSTDDEEKLKDLEKRLDDLSDSKHRLQVERDYLSDMLKEAREIAGRAEASKAELMSNARIMRETLQTAPKAAEALFSARVSAAEAEADRLRAQVKLLLEQNKLSQADEIRKKAARYNVVELKLREMEHERLSLLKEVFDGEEEREKLGRELQRIKQEYGLAIHEGVEEQIEEHYAVVASDADSSESSSEEPSQTPTPPSNPRGEPVLMDTGSQRMVYVCQWQIEDDIVMCGQVFDRREDLRTHIVRDGHIPKL